MPRSGSGVYSKPAGTTAVPNTTITSSQFNTTIDDIASDLNFPRPIASGGTNAANVADARANLGTDDAANITKGTLDDARLPALQAGKRFSSSIGVNTVLGAAIDNGKAVFLGDNDTGIRQDGDGILEAFANGVIRAKFDGSLGTVDFYGGTSTSFYYNSNQIWHAGNTGLTSGLVAQLSATAENANNLNSHAGSYYLAFINFTGQASDSQLPYDMGSKRFPGGIVLGSGVVPSGSLVGKTGMVLGDGDTGVMSGGDGLIELWSNNARVLAALSGGGFSIENITWPTANGKPLAGVSNSSVRDQTDFPIGTVLAAFTATSNVDRNASRTLAHSGSTNSDFQTTDRAGAGTALAGTWLACGRIADFMHNFRRAS